MNKVSLLLVVGAGLLIAGLALSFYGSQAVTGGLFTSTDVLGTGESMQISAELDSGAGSTAVYVVQVMNPAESQVSAYVTDPSGSIADSGAVEDDSREVRFAITDSGTYTLVVENNGRQTEIAAAFGYMPDTAAFSIGITGFYIILVGLVALAALAVIAVRRRSQLR